LLHLDKRENQSWPFGENCQRHSALFVVDFIDVPPDNGMRGDEHLHVDYPVTRLPVDTFANGAHPFNQMRTLDQPAISIERVAIGLVFTELEPVEYSFDPG